MRHNLNDGYCYLELHGIQLCRIAETIVLKKLLHSILIIFNLGHTVEQAGGSFNKPPVCCAYTRSAASAPSQP